MPHLMFFFSPQDFFCCQQKTGTFLDGKVSDEVVRGKADSHGARLARFFVCLWSCLVAFCW